MSIWRGIELFFAVIGVLTIVAIVGLFVIDFVMRIAGFDPG